MAETLITLKEPDKIHELIGKGGCKCAHLLGESESELPEARKRLIALLDEPDILAAFSVKFQLITGREDVAWLNAPFATSRESPVALQNKVAAFSNASPVDFYKVALHPDLLSDENTVHSILLSVASHASHQAVATDTILAIVDSEWNKVSRHYVLFILLTALGLCAALFCARSYRERESPHAVWLIVLWLGLISSILIELLEVQSMVRAVWAGANAKGSSKALIACASFLVHICEPRNLADIATMAMRFAAVTALSGDDVFPRAVGKAIIAADVAERWVSLLYSLRGLQAVGPRLIPIIYAVVNTKMFFMVVLFGLASFTSAYWALGARSEPSPWYAAFMIIFKLGVMGDFDMFEMEGSDTVFKDSSGTLVPEDPEPGDDYDAVHLLFYTVSLTMNIVLLNLLIGILSNNYDAYEEMGGVLFTRERASLTVSLRSAARPIAWLFRGRKEDKPTEGPIYLWKLRADDNVSEVHSLRHYVQKKLAKLEEKFDRLAKLEDKFDRLESKLDIFLEPKPKQPEESKTLASTGLSGSEQSTASVSHTALPHTVEERASPPQPTVDTKPTFDYLQ